MSNAIDYLALEIISVGNSLSNSAYSSIPDLTSAL